MLWRKGLSSFVDDASQWVSLTLMKNNNIITREIISPTRGYWSESCYIFNLNLNRDGIHIQGSTTCGPNDVLIFRFDGSGLCFTRILL